MRRRNTIRKAGQEGQEEVMFVFSCFPDFLIVFVLAPPILDLGKPMISEQPWTVGRLLEWTTQYLGQKQLESPRLEAEVLLAHAFGCKRIDLYGTRFEEEATEESRQKFRELIRRRLQGCPVAYLVGRKDFSRISSRWSSRSVPPC
jgi:hypothetical protein